MSDLARIDFRENSLTGTGGFDSVAGANSGSITVTETDPGVGVYAANWGAISDAYGIKAVTANDETFAYIYLILDAAPGADVTVLQFLNAGTVVGEIDINTSRELELKNNGTQKGSASSALTVGTLYRIGLRQKVGTGSDGEVQGYLGTKHAALTSFASSTSETFTTQADSIRVGAVDGSTFDGRIGLVAADSRQFPLSYLESHDFLVNNLGLMRVPGGSYQVADTQPAHDRAATGEARHDTFQTMSFFAQAATGGGAGQSRMMSQDKFLTGIADTRFDGYIFPPRAVQAAAGSAGTSSWYFNRGSTLYGTTATNFEQIGTSTVTAHGGAPAHKPVVDGQNNVWWATTSQTVRFWDGSSISDITPTDLIDRAYHVAAYGRHIWCIGEVDIATKGFLSYSDKQFIGAGTTRTFTQIAQVERSDILTLAIASIESTTADGASSMAVTTALSSIWPEGFTFDADDGGTAFLRVAVYYLWGGGANSSTFSVSHDTSGDDVVISFVNLEGMDPDTPLLFEYESTTGASVTQTVTAGADFQVAGFHSTVADDAPTAPTGWSTAGAEKDATLDTSTGIFYENQQDTSVNHTTFSSGGVKIVWNVNIAESPIAGQTQVIVLATANEGTTWAAAPANFGPDLYGTLRASVATSDALWLTTDRGLFRMVAQVNETVGGEEIADVGIVQQDTWEIPSDDNAGNWIASFQGLIYYPVGSTIRRYAPNSSDPNDDRAFWPPTEWSTVADKVQALVSNEGGLWFGSAGYLWNFNGNGFHQMAAEPTANDFDYLYWHQGNLYINTDAASYYKYGYPTVRPDILIDQAVLDQDDFTTGYFITSSIDFEKVADPKIIRVLETQESFTDQTTNSGSVAWHYREGCGTTADPGVGSGGDTGSSWTSWGTHAYTDGGYKRHILTTPLQCYRLFTRATLTPGSSGIPVIHYFTVWGRSIMPSVKAIVQQAQINVGQRDRENNEIVSSTAEARKMLRVVKALRDRILATDTLYHTVTINDGTDGGDEYLATFSQLQESIIEDSGNDHRVTINMTLSFEEIPG